jgi:hypothetical protein
MRDIETTNCSRNRQHMCSKYSPTVGVSLKQNLSLQLTEPRFCHTPYPARVGTSI